MGVRKGVEGERVREGVEGEKENKRGREEE